MKKDIDIEELLKRHRIEPSARVKQSILARFVDTFERKESSGTILRFWKKSIPVYAALLIVIAAGLLSFYAGRNINKSNRQTTMHYESSNEQNGAPTEEIPWHIARVDLL